MTPFSQFDRSGDQPDGAADDGLTLTDVQGYSLEAGAVPAVRARMAVPAAAAAPAGSISVDQVQLLTAAGDGGGGVPSAEGSHAGTGGGFPLGAVLSGLLLTFAGAVVALRHDRIRALVR